MRRRTFIGALGSAAAWPLTARAQEAAMPVIGYLDAGTFEPRREPFASILRGLTEAGFVEGRNWFDAALLQLSPTARPQRR
jgi:putative ABC transport system substrate-binding protein